MATEDSPGRAKKRRLSTSRQLAAGAREVIPGGISSNFRKDITFQPLFISHGTGARLYDADGNEYIDYALSYGPAILGHGNDHLRDAIVRQAMNLTSPETTELEQRAARKIIEHVPSAEQVQFACTGTEANYNAVRTARAYTGRSHVVRFHGHYHGGTDELLGGITMHPGQADARIGEFEDDLYSQMTNTAGRHGGALAETLLLEWNDLDALHRLLAARAGDIAAVLLEPVMLNNSGCMPVDGYLEGVRALCSEYDVVLIFDEVLTGFRMGLGGAQGHFGVLPDMTILAKALGGGLPVSALCGRREVMAPITRADAVVGGTYSGHPICMAAVIATIEELEKDGGAAYRRIDQLGNRLRNGLLEAAERCGEGLRLQGFPGAWVYSFTARPRIDNHAQARGFGPVRAARFNAELRKRGVLATARLCTSAAHTERDVEEALERAHDALLALG